MQTKTKTNSRFLQFIDLECDILCHKFLCICSFTSHGVSTSHTIKLHYRKQNVLVLDYLFISYNYASATILSISTSSKYFCFISRSQSFCLLSESKWEPKIDISVWLAILVSSLVKTIKSYQSITKLYL